MAKWLFALFLLFTTAITFCFLWGEIGKLSLAKPINHEKLSSYFTCIGAVGAALSILLLYKQVKLANDANVASYEPDLRFNNKMYIVKFINDVEKSKANALVAYFDKDKKQISLNNQLEITNCGNNVASDITFYFKRRRLLLTTTRFQNIFSNWKTLKYEEFISNLNPQQTVAYPIPSFIDSMMQNTREWFDRDGREWLDRKIANGTRVITTVFYIKLKFRDKTKKKYIQTIPIHIKLEDKRDDILFELSFMQPS